MALISYAQRIADHAARDPEHLAVTDETRSIARGELERLANRIARELAALGVVQGDFVTIALPNSVEFVAVVVACWKLGATPQPVSSRLPKRELDAIVELANPRVIVGVDPADHPDRVCLPAGWTPGADVDDGPLPDAVAESVQGDDIRRQHRPAEADPRGRSRAHRSRAQPAADDADRRHRT